MIELVKSIKLICQTDGHDKVYNLEVNKVTVEGKPIKYELLAEYGKRTGVLKKIVKGNFSSLWEADSTFFTILADKRKKGYVGVKEKDFKADLVTYFNKKQLETLKTNTKMTVKTTETTETAKITKLFAPMFILPKKDATTVTIDRETYEKLLAAQRSVSDYTNYTAPKEPKELVGRKFRDD